MSDTPEIGPFVQLAYFVADAEAAARRWAREFGAGPFFLMAHIPLENAVYRGTPAAIAGVVSIAIGFLISFVLGVLSGILSVARSSGAL